MYKVRFIFLDGMKEDMFFNSKLEALQERDRRKKCYKCVVKKRKRS